MLTLDVVPSGSLALVDSLFTRGLRDCCARYGIDAGIPPVAPESHALVRLVVIRDAGGTMIAGARVHERHAQRGFPAETALRRFYAARDRVRSMSRDTIEFDALWISAQSHQRGLARLLIQGCVASGVALGKPSAFTVSHDRFAPALAAIGMAPVLDIPDVPYPNPAYRSRLYTADLTTLRGAAARDKQIIGEIATSLRAGEALALEEITAIELGQPIWTVRPRDRVRRRTVA